MKLVFASTNKGKINEIKRLLDSVEVLSLNDINFNEKIIEDGSTFAENAYIKAKTVFDYCGMLTLADDSGLCVEALDGAPGVYSARFSKTGLDEDNNTLLLEKLKNQKNRNAKYVCALVAIWPNGESKTYIGELKGKIIDDYRGNNGFGYDPLVYLEELGKTTAEINMEEKNKISHRGLALKMFKEDLDKMER